MSHYFEHDKNLKSQIYEIKYELSNRVFKFKSNNGLFSKNQIDYGSALLIETFLANNLNLCNQKILDLGSGYGAIGIVLASLLNLELASIDINPLAVDFTKQNFKLNQLTAVAIESDGFNGVSDKYDLIISNPPIRVGNKMLFELLATSHDHLKENGELWLVLRKQQGAESIIKFLKNYYQVEIVNKKSGFYIIRAIKG